MTRPPLLDSMALLRPSVHVTMRAQRDDAETRAEARTRANDLDAPVTVLLPSVRAPGRWYTAWIAYPGAGR